MNPTNFVYVALFAAIGITHTAIAQNPGLASVQHMQNMPAAPQAMPRPVFSEFPTPEELARMTPPEPITEEMIKKRFSKIRKHVEETTSRDRKQAEKYARDFARFQQYQADQLAKIMARAEKQREKLLNRVNEREQQALENFRKRSQNKQIEAQHY